MLLPICAVVVAGVQVLRWSFSFWFKMLVRVLITSVKTNRLAGVSFLIWGLALCIVCAVDRERIHALGEERVIESVSL